jgi:hypothetical protein
MRLKVQGPAGKPAQIAITVTPRSNTKILDADDNEFRATGQLQTVGTVPVTVNFTVQFFERPWTLDVDVAVDGVPIAHHEETDGGLAEIIMNNPDTEYLRVVFEGE